MTYERHPLEIGPLVFGLVFLGIVTAWGLFELGLVSGADAAWILPVVLIAAGALGIALAATKDRRAETRRRGVPTPPPAADPAAVHTGADGPADDSPTDAATDATTSTTTHITNQTRERDDD
jgi:hypothetical protein